METVLPGKPSFIQDAFEVQNLAVLWEIISCLKDVSLFVLIQAADSLAIHSAFVLHITNTNLRKPN